MVISTKRTDRSSIVYFLIGLAFILSNIAYIYNGARYLQYITHAFIIFILIQRIPTSGKVKNVFILVLTYIAILIVRGVYLNNYIPYLLNDIYLWSSVVYILVLSSKSSLYSSANKIPTLFARLLYIMVPFTLAILYFYGNISDEIIDRNLVSGLVNSKAVFNPILYTPLLMPFLFELSKKLRILVLIANILLLILGIISATRGLVIVVLLSFVCLLFQIRNTSKIRVFKVLALVVLGSFVVYNFLSPNNKTFIFEKIGYLIARSNTTIDISSGRASEVSGLFNEYKWDEFLLGRGAGGNHDFGFWKTIDLAGDQGIPMAHFGFLHLILKGGIPFLLIIYSLIIWSIYNLWRRGDRKYAFVLIIYLVYELSISKFNDPLYLLFLWLSIGYSLKLSECNLYLTKYNETR